MRIGIACLGLAIGACQSRIGPPIGSRPDAARDGKYEFPDATAALPKSCAEARADGVSTDGIVSIYPDGTNKLDVYCNMTASGGGWMLVWVTGFTNYPNFANGTNAIIPRPSWTAPNANVVVSTTLPTDPTNPGALDFAKWPQYGSEFLVTSTINHWVRCSPGTGSLVTETAGTITCEVVKVVPQKCLTSAPDHLYVFPTGPSLNIGANTNFYYFFDGFTGGNWPVHDPCGMTQTNQLQGVASPMTAIYLR